MENIFHSRRHIMAKLCSLIINGGSSVNVSILRLVEKKGEIVVDRQVSLAFTLGKYSYKRPWQFDRKVTHNKVTNRFSFENMGQKVTL
ncbi:hypothetical protein CR513_20718, partial [Mucuna pruriens]